MLFQITVSYTQTMHGVVLDQTSQSGMVMILISLLYTTRLRGSKTGFQGEILTITGLLKVAASGNG